MYIRTADRTRVVNMAQAEQICLRENGNVVAMMQSGAVIVLGTYDFRDAGMELALIAEGLKIGQALYDMTPRARYDIQRR